MKILHTADWHIGMFLGVLHGGSSHAHCHYLQVMFEGGLVGFALFANIYVLLIRRTSKIQKNNAVKAALVGLLMFSIGAVVEVFDYATMYIVFVLVYYAQEVSREERTFQNTDKNQSKIMMRVRHG